MNDPSERYANFLSRLHEEAGRIRNEYNSTIESFNRRAHTRAEDQPAQPYRSTAPVIVFENKSSIIGQDASIAWEIPRSTLGH